MLNMVNELHGIARAFLHLYQFLNPFLGVVMGTLSTAISVFVQPVLCYTMVGNIVHLFGAYLYFDRGMYPRTCAIERGVNRLVAV